MSKDDLFEVMKRINIAYGTSKFPVTDEIFDVWFDMLSDYDYEIMQQATKRFVLKSDFPPTIAGLVKEYDGIVDEQNKAKKELNQWWDAIKSTYPRVQDDYTVAREYYDNLTMGDPSRGNALYTMVCVEIKKADRKAIEDGTGHRIMPTLDDYLAGVKTK